MRIESKFFRPTFPRNLDSRWEDGRKITLADLEADQGGWTLMGNFDNPLEREALELWKQGNRVFGYHLESQCWVTYKEFQEIVNKPKAK
jgi:hypothetical protein